MNDEENRRKDELCAALKNVIHTVNPSSTNVLDNEGNHIVSGSGTLIIQNNRVFLVTAGHVIKNRPIHSIRLYIFSKRAYVPFRILNWDADDREEVDVAYLELDANDFAPFCRDDPYDPPREIYRKPIECSNISRKIDRNRGVFLFGYPTSWEDYVTVPGHEIGYPLVGPIGFLRFVDNNLSMHY
jgi:hypothetical protein